jgi:hypothetical protein
MHKKSLGLLGLLLATLSSCASQPRTETLASVIDRHTQARGGRAAIEAVRKVEIDLTIEEPTYAADATYAATRDNQMRIDVLMRGERLFTEALDGSRSWELPKGATAATPGSEQGTRALHHGLEFPFKVYGLHELEKRGHKLALLGREQVDGIDYHVLLLTLDDGFEVRYYVNPKSWLIDRERQFRALHVDIDPTPRWIETTHSDYQPTAGVLYPHRDEEHVVDTHELLSSSSVKAIRVNPPIDVRRFAMPD